MKQLLSIIFSLILAVTLSGFLTFIHTCGGEIQSISLIPLESCEMEAKDSCHSKTDQANSCHLSEESSCCQAESAPEDDCCQDVHIYQEFDQPILFSPLQSFPDFLVANVPITYFSSELPIAFLSKVPFQENTRPPPESVPLYIQFQRLTFYA